MECKCDYFMYFPSAPISSLSNLAEYTTLPRRNHVYLGETVQFLFILRSRNALERVDCPGVTLWKETVGSLSARASACVAQCRYQRPGGHHVELPSACSENVWEDLPERNDPGRRSDGSAPLILNTASDGRQNGSVTVKSPLVLDNQVIFCLTVSLDKLPVNAVKAKIIVTVWRQEEESMEVKEHGYLTLLQLRNPLHTFTQDLSTFKAQVSTIINVLHPPTVHCQQMAVPGKHLVSLKVLNCSTQEEVSVTDMKIIPNYNSSFLPMMPDGSVLIVDNVCHKSAEVTMASFYRINSKSSRLPSVLSALEEQNFLFHLQLQDKEEEDSSVGMEVPLVAVIQWHTPTLSFTRYISSCYSLSSVSLDRPRLLMTASCASAVRPLEHFTVKYTLQNNLCDFLAIRLIWNSEAHREGQKDPRVAAVVCQSPYNHLGQCRKGSTLSFHVGFQILRTGVFELSKSMKLKLQFTAPPSTSPTEGLSPLRSATKAAIIEQQEKHGLGRSHSFSHQDPPRSHHIRSASVMECSSTASPGGCSVSSAPYHLPSAHGTISLDKIVKRECKVLVLETI